MIPNGADSPSLVLQGTLRHDLLDPKRTHSHPYSRDKPVSYGCRIPLSHNETRDDLCRKRVCFRA
jgi:hypothetical protein